jgi:carbon storage regulator
MLVLSRSKGERIVINGDIVVTVVSIRGDTVKIGIEAPQHVPVDRQEIRDAKRLRPEIEPLDQR